MTKKYEQIILRVTKKEKEIIKNKAGKENLSVNEFIKYMVLDNDVLNSKNDSKENMDYTEKGINSILQEQLNVKDQQILELTKLLDQQQKLLLQEQNKNKLLLEEASEKIKWWKFWK